MDVTDVLAVAAIVLATVTLGLDIVFFLITKSAQDHF